MQRMLNTSGIKIKTPMPFCERYDSRLNARFFGDDNLYPQHIKDFFANSPTFNATANRKYEFLYGNGTSSSLIDNKVLKAILLDYSIFNGFAIHISYDGLGDITNVDYVPFETIRLGEQGANGLYTYCYYCPDWAGVKTINKKQVNPSTDKVRYWMYTTDIDTRLKRIEAANGAYNGEILYYSNTISYPVPNINAVLNYVSAEVGLSNIIYRDVRANFLPASVLSVPKQSDEDANALSENLTALQGDDNSFKILMFEHLSDDDKPEVLNLQGEDYMARYTAVIEECKNKIISAYGQEAFIRLADGSLGFGSEAIGSIYTYYNFNLRTQRAEIIECLKAVDPAFVLNELQYNVIGNV